jgi:hypothetical protein
MWVTQRHWDTCIQAKVDNSKHESVYTCNGGNLVNVFDAFDRFDLWNDCNVAICRCGVEPIIRIETGVTNSRRKGPGRK